MNGITRIPSPSRKKWPTLPCKSNMWQNCVIIFTYRLGGKILEVETNKVHKCINIRYTYVCWCATYMEAITSSKVWPKFSFISKWEKSQSLNIGKRWVSSLIVIRVTDIFCIVSVYVLLFMWQITCMYIIRMGYLFTISYKGRMSNPPKVTINDTAPIFKLKKI